LGLNKPLEIDLKKEDQIHFSKQKPTTLVDPKVLFQRPQVLKIMHFSKHDFSHLLRHAAQIL